MAHIITDPHDFNGQPITNLPDPVNDQDPVTKKYFNDNAGEPGSSNTIYTADDALTGDRTVDLAEHELYFKSGDITLFLLNGEGGEFGRYNELLSPNGTSVIDLWSDKGGNGTAIDILAQNITLNGQTNYNGDGKFLADRAVDLDGKLLSVLNGSVGLLQFDPVGFQTGLSANNGTAGSSLTLNSDLAGANVNFTIGSDDGVNNTNIQGDAIDNSIIYTAAFHTFNGKIINPDIVSKNFVDDASAQTGGVAVGEDYHTDGVKKVRIV